MNKVYYFTATWCGPCKTLKPIVQQAIAETGANVSIIDVDMAPELAEKHQIRSVPTIIVLDDAGMVVKHRSGVMSKQDVINLIT